MIKSLWCDGSIPVTGLATLCTVHKVLFRHPATKPPTFYRKRFPQDTIPCGDLEALPPSPAAIF